MKKVVTACVILITAFLSKKATAQNASSAVLNIVLHPVQTIEVGGSDNSVNLEYKTREDYSQGVSLNKENHLKIYSTGGFVVNVRTSDQNLTSTATSKSIEAGDITVTAATGTSNGMESFTSSPVHLSGSDTAFITSLQGAAHKTFDVTYAAKGDNKFINHYTKTQNPTVYTTQVVYSILPQ